MVIVARYRLMVNTHKEARIREIVLSGILPLTDVNRQGYNNSKRRAINVDT